MVPIYSNAPKLPATSSTSGTTTKRRERGTKTVTRDRTDVLSNASWRRLDSPTARTGIGMFASITRSQGIGHPCLKIPFEGKRRERLSAISAKRHLQGERTSKDTSGVTSAHVRTNASNVVRLLLGSAIVAGMRGISLANLADGVEGVQ